MKNRGKKVVKTVQITEKNGPLVCIRAVNGDEDCLIMTNEGIVIRISLESLAVRGRNTMGVRLIKFGENAFVSNIAIVDKSEDAEKAEIGNDEEDSEQILDKESAE